MKTTRGIFLFVIVVATLALGSNPASATALFDNLGASVVDSDGVSSFGPLADSFSTNGSATSLTDVKVILRGDPASTGDISVSLLADQSTSPGALIATLGSIAAGSLGNDLVYDFSLGTAIALAPDTRYWIELTTSNDSARWPWSFDLNGTGVASEFFANVTGVHPNINGPYLMRVNAIGEVPTVPEPATISLVGISILALGILRWRKRLVASSELS